MSVCRMDDVAGKETVYYDTADPCPSTPAKPELRGRAATQTLPNRVPKLWSLWLRGHPRMSFPTLPWQVFQEKPPELAPTRGPARTGTAVTSLLSPGQGGTLVGAGTKLAARQAAFCTPSAGIYHRGPNYLIIKVLSARFGTPSNCFSFCPLLSPEPQQPPTTLVWWQTGGTAALTQAAG